MQYHPDLPKCHEMNCLVVVLVVDGFFQAITCPMASEVLNQTLYYSGHYENFGLNCQAICTHNLTFIYFRVVAPGSMNDIIAITKTDNLMDKIQKLALGRFLVVTEHLLTPYTGSQILDQGKDAFNFYIHELDMLHPHNNLM